MNTKTRKHSICEKMPYVAVILGMIIPSIIVAIGGSAGEGISSYAGNIGICIFAVMAMLVFKFWYAPKFKGFVRPEVSIKDICIIMIPFVVLVVLTVLEPLFIQRPFYYNPSLGALFMGLAAGFGEETMFRICSLAIVMRYVKKEKRFTAVIILTLIFGLSHLGNIMSGADTTMTILQLITSTFHGFLFATLYLKTGSAIFPIFAHGLYDFISFTMEPTATENGIITHQYGTVQLIFEVSLAVIIGIASLYMLRKDKLAAADEIWDKKWSVN